MSTVTAHVSRRCRPLLASAVLVPSLLLALAVNTPGASGGADSGAAFTQTRSVAHHHGVRPSYGWPVKPFNRQHPVRAYLDDPRNGHGDAKSFHFGIDVTAPNGSGVYAVEAGEVFVTRGRMAVAVKGALRTFGYWHVRPVVRNHQLVEAHQLLGHIVDEGGGDHVHFAERRNGVYVNPLRPGGLGPYVDRTPPTVASVEFLRNGHELAPNSLSGRVRIVAEIFDTTPVLVPKPWAHLPVTPARVRWSITHGSSRIVVPRTTADFRDRMLPAKLYDSIYAPGTVQNFKNTPGHYRFYLAHVFAASRLPAGRSQLRIEATDTRGNRTVALVSISRADG
jgi:murein DD-endopeptidase MepM/ murein hydrolase activator NlpD